MLNLNFGCSIKIPPPLDLKPLTVLGVLPEPVTLNVADNDLATFSDPICTARPTVLVVAIGLNTPRRLSNTVNLPLVTFGDSPLNFGYLNVLGVSVTLLIEERDEPPLLETLNPEDEIPEDELPTVETLEPELIPLEDVEGKLDVETLDLELPLPEDVEGKLEIESLELELLLDDIFFIGIALLIGIEDETVNDDGDGVEGFTTDDEINLPGVTTDEGLNLPSLAEVKTSAKS